MKVKFIILFVVYSVCSFGQSAPLRISYHEIKTDSSGKILPWYSNDPGKSYDHIINILWKFWDTMKIDSNGLPYYMNHQVWKKNSSDNRGIGGDQISMALSSWRLLYAYTGNSRILDNMKFMADYYLAHSLSPENSAWPNIPFPYNTSLYSGVYDGDMILGKDYTQPDKAGSFAYELVNLYKMSGEEKYLNAAIKIANTLTGHIVPGHQYESPLPFRVNAITGEIGSLKEGQREKIKYNYTSNWSSTMCLFKELAKLKKGNTAEYLKGYKAILDWMIKYPMTTNKWGPFFEDVALWSDTQINAITFAEYILNNREEFPNWKKDSFQIIDWVYDELVNDKWESYGVAAINEQTHYRVPGNSHTARQGAIELLYASLTGDNFRKSVGIRELNWATYMVNDDGENTYLNNETWLTDGYGDYVRHYLKAFAAFPELAPEGQNHLLKSLSVLKSICYRNSKIQYEVFDSEAEEVIRLTTKPKKVSINNQKIYESPEGKGNCWYWTALKNGGILKVDHKNGNKITITF
ncbi:MAG: hypothetical protein Q8933_09190 [Bacteroidota bacterium]|nr:hypothetical protein [Bacteroidota bacterium]MDP4194969.1 hypothetical protein [Bacteroidota bacterium]